MAGLNVIVVVSDDHAWNMIKLNGTYYHIDTTWDDTENAGTYYFNMGTDYIIDTSNHEHDLSRLPSCGARKNRRAIAFPRFFRPLRHSAFPSSATADIREGVAVEYVSCEPSENLKELFSEEYGEEYEAPEDEKTEQA